jgi:hypothetical protein
MAMTTDEAVRARAALERAEGIARSGRLFAAREATTTLLTTAGAALDEDAWRRALRLLAGLSGEAWRVPLVEPLERAAAAPGDAEALGALGSALIGEREPAMAAAVLARARARAPAEARWLNEQVAALELCRR